MTLFEHIWCEDRDGTRPSLTEAWVRAQVQSGALPARLGRVCRLKNKSALERFISKVTFSANPEVQAETVALLAELLEEWKALPETG